MHIHVLGAGAWGTALALACARRHTVTLWAHRADHAATLQRDRHNAQHLPGVPFPEHLQVRVLPCAADGQPCDLIIVATPAHAVLDTVRATRERIPRHHPPLIIASKGCDPTTGGLLPPLVDTAWDAGTALWLSGPSFARELAGNQPTAVVLAGPPHLTVAAAQALRQPRWLIDTSPDRTGVALGGVYKNVIAIASGMADTLALGANAKAALITRGLAEMQHLGQALGAQPETLCGLAGAGDLFLTASDSQSRNFRLGQHLGQGLSAAAARTRIGQVTEGQTATPHVVRMAAHHGVAVPLATTVHDVLLQRLLPQEALDHLISHVL